MKRLVLALAISLLLASGSVMASGSGTDLSADQVIMRLKEGNARYVSGKMLRPNQTPDRRKVTSDKGQKPLVTVLGCADSREPLEMIFDAGIGDVFVVRVAGNVVNVDEAGSIEYGAEHLGTPVVLVLGHTKCGAVTAVVKGDHVEGNIPALVSNIVPVAEEIKKANPGDSVPALTDKCITGNIWQSVDDLFKKSGIIRHLVKEGKLKVLAGLYDIESGKVQWMGEHPQQDKLLTYTGGAH